MHWNTVNPCFSRITHTPWFTSARMLSQRGVLLGHQVYLRLLRTMMVTSVCIQEISYASVLNKRIPPLGLVYNSQRFAKCDSKRRFWMWFWKCKKKKMNWKRGMKFFFSTQTVSVSSFFKNRKFIDRETQFTFQFFYNVEIVTDDLSLVILFIN